jgi:hypothetical protein
MLLAATGGFQMLATLIIIPVLFLIVTAELLR